MLRSNRLPLQRREVAFMFDRAIALGLPEDHDTVARLRAGLGLHYRCNQRLASSRGNTQPTQAILRKA